MAETSERRRRGRRPADAQERRERVLAALRDLESARVPFSMQDLAERAGISRSTLYRDATLRDLVGGRGDSPLTRPVDSRRWDALQKEAASLRDERRAIRRELAQLRGRLTVLEAENEALKQEQKERHRVPRGGERSAEEWDRLRAEAYAEGFAAGTRAVTQRGAGRASGSVGLAAVAARLPRPAVLAARRVLTRALHPDLFARDPAAALLATEILKQLNGLADAG